MALGGVWGAKADLVAAAGKSGNTEYVGSRSRNEIHSGIKFPCPREPRGPATPALTLNGSILVLPHLYAVLLRFRFYTPPLCVDTLTFRIMREIGCVIGLISCTQLGDNLSTINHMVSPFGRHCPTAHEQHNANYYNSSTGNCCPRVTMLPIGDQSTGYRGNLFIASAMSCSVGAPYFLPSVCGACPVIMSDTRSLIPHRSAICLKVCRHP
jgi:hypothetical protein